MQAVPIALPDAARQSSVARLNFLLADLLTLAALYKKAHWQVTGPHFHSLHLLYDEQHGEVARVVDAVAERIQALGGITVATPHDVAETTRLPRAPQQAETASVQLRRLVDATEMILTAAREAAQEAAAHGDDGTNDLIVGQVIRPVRAAILVSSLPLGRI